MSPALRRVHTCDLSASDRRAVRALMDRSFGDDFTDDDWDHALGGLHVVAEQDGEVVGHAAVVQRHLTVDGISYRVGYVEAVAVAHTARRQGIGASVMSEIERIIDSAYDFGALAATDDGRALYAVRRWRLWVGPIGVVEPTGTTSTPDATGALMVHAHARSPRLDVERAELLADARRGDPW